MSKTNEVYHQCAIFRNTKEKNLKRPSSWEMSWMIRVKNPSVVLDEPSQAVLP